jgi:hypothetical protein
VGSTTRPHLVLRRDVGSGGRSHSRGGVLGRGRAARETGMESGRPKGRSWSPSGRRIGAAAKGEIVKLWGRKAENGTAEGGGEANRSRSKQAESGRWVVGRVLKAVGLPACASHRGWCFPARASTIRMVQGAGDFDGSEAPVTPSWGAAAACHASALARVAAPSWSSGTSVRGGQTRALTSRRWLPAPPRARSSSHGRGARAAPRASWEQRVCVVRMRAAPAVFGPSGGAHPVSALALT